MIYAFGLLALGLAWLLPGHYYPWVAFQQDTLSACGAWLIGLAAVVSVREWPARVSPLACVSGVLALVPLVQWATGILPFVSDALLAASYLMAFALTIIAGTQVARSRQFVGGLLATIGIAAAVSVGLCLVQWLDLGPIGFVEQLGPGSRMAANFTQPNQLASLLGMAVVAVIWAFERRRIGGPVATAALSFVGCGLVMTQARVSWLFVLVFILMWALGRRRIPLRTPGYAVAVASALFGLAVFAWAPLNASMHTGAFAVPVAERAQAGYRLAHWETLWDALMRSPWIGYGWQQTSVAQQAAVLDHPPTFESLIASHNQLLDLLIWNGFPIGLLVIAFIGWWAVTRMRRCVDIDTWAMLTALGVLFTHSMVEFPLQYAYFLLPAGLMIGVIEARSVVEARPPVSMARGLFVCALLLMAGLLATVFLEYVKVEEAVRRVRLRDAGYVQPGFAPEVPRVDLLDGPREYIWLMLVVPHEHMPPADLDKMRAIVSRNNTPAAMLRYAAAATLNDRNAEADRVLRIMCRTQLERQCDQGRKLWAAWVTSQPRLGSVRYPDTPSR